MSKLSYVCLQKPHYENEQHTLTSIRKEDMEQIRLWRNAQTSILRQSKPLTEQEQVAYFENILLPSFSEETPRQILFSILQESTLIGYGGLVHIDWHAKRAEVSFLLDTDIKEESKAFAEQFSAFLETIAHFAFHELKLVRLVAETYETRPYVMNLLQEFGFTQEGVLRQHVFKDQKWLDSHLFALLSENTYKKENQKGVLVTSISNKVPLLKAVRTAIKKSSTFTSLHGMDMNGECIGKYFVDFFWHAPTLSELSFEMLLKYCQEHKIGAIIPTRDADLLFFSTLIEKLQEHNIFVCSSSTKTIALCQDKKKFSDTLIQKGYPAIPGSFSLHEIAATRYVVKECSGAASQNLGKNLSYEEALEWGKKLQKPLFQPYIDGKEYSIDLYRSSDGKVIGTSVRERNLIIHGESQVTTTVRDEALEILAESLAHDLEIYGPAVVQVIKTPDDKIRIIECNARFGGASCASIAVGLDSFFWFLKECENTKTVPEFHRIRGEVKQIRHLQDLLLYSW